MKFDIDIKFQYQSFPHIESFFDINQAYSWWFENPRKKTENKFKNKYRKKSCFFVEIKIFEQPGLQQGIHYDSWPRVFLRLQRRAAKNYKFGVWEKLFLLKFLIYIDIHIRYGWSYLVYHTKMSSLFVKSVIISII